MNIELKTGKLVRKLFYASIMLAVVTVSCVEETNQPALGDPPVITDFSPREGRVNQEVIITGENFGEFIDAIDVTFNGTVATVTSATPTEIVVNAPAGGTSGEIAVSVFGQSTTTSEGFTYLVSSTITGISPDSGAPGDEVTITGTNFGTDAGAVSVMFYDGVEATVISVTDTEIVVEVPTTGITGPIAVTVGPETVPGPVFTFPFVGISQEFDENDGGWEPQQDGTATAENGQLVVDFNGGNRADLRFNQSVLIDAGNFPILAIKMTRLGDFNLTLDTDLGTFGGGANKYTGILHGDVYYWDLTSDEFVHSNGNTMLSTTEPTLLEMLQFKIADVASGESGYSVDFIRSFESLESLEAYAQLPVGKYVFEFDNGDFDWDAGQKNQGVTTVVEDSKLKVTFGASQFEGTNKRRADLYYVINNTFPWEGSAASEGDPDYKASWVYHKDYPILAIKIIGKPASGAFKRDMAGTGSIPVSDSQADVSISAGSDVYYWDMSNGDDHGGKFIDETAENFDAETGTVSYPTWQFKIADITTPEAGYEVDWVRTFQSVEEMNAFINQ